MERSFKELLEQKTAETEAAVYAYLPEEKGFQKTIFEAMNYSCLLYTSDAADE